MTPTDIFEFFRACVHTPEGKVIFILMLIAIAMIIDFITGTIAAVVNPEIEFKSKAGMELVQVAILIAIAIALGIIFKTEITSFVNKTFKALNASKF